MELYLLISLVLGLALGICATWLFMRQSLERGVEVARSEGAIEVASLEAKNTAFEELKNDLARRLEVANIGLTTLRAESNLLSTSLATSQQQHSDSQRQLFESHQTAVNLNVDLNALRESQQEMQNELLKVQTTLNSERQILVTNTKLLDDAKKALTLQLEQIVQQMPNKIASESKEKLDDLLKPFQLRLVELQNTVAAATLDGAIKNTALSEQIKSFSEQSIKVNETVVNLTNALKGSSKIQGNWGEQILDRTLEISGLRKGIDYLSQPNVRDESGANRRPDYVVNLPDGKHLVIDSKVSITAYEAYMRSDDEGVRDQLAKDHVRSIRNHVADLSSKKYDQLVSNTPNFTMLFVPIESALYLAMASDENLVQSAMSVGIVFATPMTLLPVLRTIDFVWKQEQQQKNVDDIIKKTTSLYEKFVGFVKNLDDVETKLKQAQESLSDSKRQLATGKDNLVRKVEVIRSLGLTPKNLLPPNLLLDSGIDVIDVAEE